MKRNKFSKALKQLKTTELDERIKSLEESVPTNSIGGVYALNQPGQRLGPYDPPKVFYPDTDGNWPDGIPGTPGERSYTRPAGHWEYGPGAAPSVDWDNTVDFSHSGTSTDGFIDPTDGTVLSNLPPDSSSFILGPLVDGYTYNHGYDDFTNIGYIQKDTRQFVLLARIQGYWKSGSAGNAGAGRNPAREWGGESDGFTSYNENFTLAMAQWFRDQYNNGIYIKNVSYFYNGGQPQSDNPDPNAPPGSKGGICGGAGSGGGPDEEGPYGSGGDPNIGTPQNPPNQGGPDDAGFPWGMIGDALKGLQNIGKTLSPLADLLLGTDDSILADPKNLEILDGLVNKVGQIFGTKVGAVQGLIAAAAVDMRGYIQKQVLGGDNEVFLRGGDFPVMQKTDNELQYAGNLALSLQKSMATGQPVMINDSNLNPSIVGRKLTSDDIVNSISTHGVNTKYPTQVPTDANSILNPNNKKPYFGGKGFGSEGGSVLEPYIAPDGTPMLRNTADKFFRLGGESGEGIDFQTQTFTDVPTPTREQLQSAVDTAINSDGFSNVMSVLTNAINTGLTGAGAQSQGVPGLVPTQRPVMPIPTTPEQIRQAIRDGVGEQLSKSGSQIINFPGMGGVTGSGTGMINGAAASSLVYSQAKKVLGLRPETEMEQLGGHGHVRRETHISINDLQPEQQKVFIQQLDAQGVNYNKNWNNVKESKEVLTESRKRILREIKQPYKLPEQPKQKYKMNFKGKFRPQNTPDVTASKQTDEGVKAQNAAGQTWRTKDKHWSRYQSQERMNVIYDHIGHGNQYWDMIVNENQNKKGTRDRQIQEYLNIIAHEKAMLQEDPNYISPFKQKIEEQETLQADKDPLFKKVASRLKTKIDYPDKPSKKGYPDTPPPEMVNGFHPEYGNKGDYYNKLDPQSAEAMPPTGNAEIDAKVQKAKRIKKVLGKKG